MNKKIDTKAENVLAMAEFLAHFNTRMKGNVGMVAVAALLLSTFAVQNFCIEAASSIK